MRRYIYLVGIIYFFIMLWGCSVSTESGNSNKDSMLLEEVEQETVLQGSIEDKESMAKGDAQEKADKNSIDEKIYITENYGEIQEYGGEFYYDESTKGFYYNIESFYLNSDFLYTMNDTLETFYDEYLKQYQETQEWYMEQGKQELPDGNVPYSKLKFQGVQYVDNDYISLLFADVTYMGAATTYSMFDAITLDRHTGEEVCASEILEESNTEILETVNELMGLDEPTDWSQLDFYLQKDKIVFFYRTPGFWEDVVLGR